MALSNTGGVVGYWKNKEAALVPTSRTVNSKALSSNITIARSDIIANAENDYNSNIHDYVVSDINSAVGAAIGGEY